VKITIELDDVPAAPERKRLVAKTGKKWRVMARGPGGPMGCFPGNLVLGTFDLVDASQSVVIWLEEDT